MEIAALLFRSDFLLLKFLVLRDLILYEIGEGFFSPRLFIIKLLRVIDHFEALVEGGTQGWVRLQTRLHEIVQSLCVPLVQLLVVPFEDSAVFFFTVTAFKRQLQHRKLVD